MLHLFIDILRNSILITGLVVVMMMMIESLNIESRGMLFKGLRKTRVGQVVVAALLGSVPGCIGGFATVSLYTHRLFSFGALVAMMIASSGDEAFMMLAMFPEQALVLFAVLFAIAVTVGIVTDLVGDRLHKRHCHKEDHMECGTETECEGYVLHASEQECHHSHTKEENGTAAKKRHFGWHRTVMFIGVAVFIVALASGRLGHDHGSHDGEHCHDGEHQCCHHTHCTDTGHDTGADLRTADSNTVFHIDLLSEDWMNVMFAALSIFILVVLIFASDHFIEEHLWHHIVKRHLPTIFAWTFGVLLVVGIGLQYVNISDWISDNTVLMILLATAIGIIPESGPHMIFVTLYAAGIVPMPVLLASCISQDGHASLPLIAESKKSFLQAKVINCIAALAAGFISLAFM